MADHLKLITAPSIQKTPLRKHLDEAADHAFSCSPPIQGYALVTFHDDCAYTVAFHTPNAGIHPLDLGDIVKRRIQSVAIKREP